jgi:hypothetical protein
VIAAIAAIGLLIHGNCCSLFSSVLLFTRVGAWRLAETWILAAYWPALFVALRIAVSDNVLSPSLLVGCRLPVAVAIVAFLLCFVLRAQTRSRGVAPE